MKNPALIGEMVRAAVQASGKPVSVKIRSGWDDGNVTEIAKIVQENGAAMLTVHGRTVRQGYSGAADWNAVADAVRAADIPVIGNGDVFTPLDAKNMLEQTGCAGVMLGRGTLGNPFLIRDTVSYLRTGELPEPPTIQEKIELAKRHIALIVRYKGEVIGIKEARKHAAWYVKGLPGSMRVKGLITGAKTYDEMCGLLEALCSYNG
jgi:nifR3 family TIM-barrel protein